MNPPIQLPEMLLESLNLNVVMFRDRKTGNRIVHQIGEFLVKENNSVAHIVPNILYEWDPKTKKQMLKHKSSRFYTDLAQHTALSTAELEKEILDKAKIIEWMVKHDLKGVDQVGKIVKEYYLDPEIVMDIVNKNKKPSTLQNE